jgi:DNA-binding NarL/FixJ family response regulator
MKASPLSILIIDDDAEFRALAALLLQSHGYEVVGQSGDAASAVDAAVSLRPNAILLDINLPDHDGFWVAQAVTEAGVRSRILLTSSELIDVSPRTLDRCGAVAFVPKTELATTDLSGLLQ